MIRACAPCKPHPYQDTTYGPHFRVKNKCEKGFRCTVCETIEIYDHKSNVAKPEAKKVKN